ncbi:uncharacterized protein LOC134280493 [Saccostrea cucullata]|uniref:uncharacterized protein LOC134280493 n=1 Tax=Saccostrea cuccullata TaxID=36930 RepID=UPI002ED374C2
MNKRQELKRKGNRSAFFLSEAEQENISRIIEKRQDQKRLKKSTRDLTDSKTSHKDSENNPQPERGGVDNSSTKKAIKENKDVLKLDETDFFRQYMIQNSPLDTVNSVEEYATLKSDSKLQEVAIKDIAAKTLTKIKNLEEKVSLLSTQVDDLKHALTTVITSEQEKNKKIKYPPVPFFILTFLITLGIIVIMIICITR